LSERRNERRKEKEGNKEGKGKNEGRKEGKERNRKEKEGREESGPISPTFLFISDGVLTFRVRADVLVLFCFLFVATSASCLLF
jgi:hypothetical protein